MQKTLAILTRKVKYSESSAICWWCSPSHGIIRTMARGAFRPKSTLRGKLELFCLCEILYRESRSGDLHTLSEATPQHHFNGIAKSYEQLLQADYLVRLLETVAEPGTPIPELYTTFFDSLQSIEIAPLTLTEIENIELKICQSLGLQHSQRKSTQILLHHFPGLNLTRREMLAQTR